MLFIIKKYLLTLQDIALRMVKNGNSGWSCSKDDIKEKDIKNFRMETIHWKKRNIKTRKDTTDDVKVVAGKNQMTTAQDRKKWKNCKEAYIAITV